MSNNRSKEDNTTALYSDVVGQSRESEIDLSPTSVNLCRNQDALFIDFFVAMSSVEDVGEAKLFLSDLLSNAEIRMLARRLRIAVYLVSGYSYTEISKDLKASPTTIRKVSQWLERQGLGYTLVIKRLAEIGGLAKPEILTEKNIYKNRHKKPSRNALYFWPTALIESILESSKRKKSR
jgi:TrpR-related protein YerC/YecD